MSATFRAASQTFRPRSDAGALGPERLAIKHRLLSSRGEDLSQVGAPSLVLGSKDLTFPAISRHPDQSPEYFVRFVHQYGGHACVTAEMLGVLFPLHLNLQHVSNETELSDVFGALRSDLLTGFGPDTAENGLSRWQCNGYLPMDDEGRRIWNRALARWIDVPPIVDGVEALLEFGDFDSARLIDWTTPAFRWQEGESMTAGRRRFASEDLARVLAFARRHELGDPRLWLTWENSD